MSSLRRHSRPVDDRRPWLLLFFLQISLFFYGDFLFGVGGVGQHATKQAPTFNTIPGRDKSSLTNARNWRETGS